MDTSYLHIILALGLIVFLRKRALRYLRYLQQEEYNPKRFISWLLENNAFDTRGVIVSLLGLATLLLPDSSFANIIILAQAGLFAMLGLFEEDPRDAGKKKLVLTERATKIFDLSFFFGMMIILASILAGITTSIYFMILYCQLVPFILVFSVLLLKPAENNLQNKLKSEAHKKFLDINPYSIGVTGSFGKTSVKNLLGDVLSMSLGPTFFPQQGVNTPMGITREIRERLTTYDKYAVIEMGAYHIGSIKRLCDLTPINAAIVTAVHLVHLERFGSEEAVYKAKSELAQAVPSNGILVVNGDNAGARKMATEHKKEKTFIYGLDTEKGPLDTVISDWKYLKHGTEFTISREGISYQGFTKMHGRSALSNIAATFTMACALGAKPELVLAIIRDIAAVSNRLEVKDYGSFVQINDAYNSNPIGFEYALEVLRDMPGERKILVTPGMIELGHLRDEENKKIAVKAAKVCDLVLIVNELNKKSLMSGLQEGGLDSSKVMYFETRDEALSYYQSIRKDNDVLLLENDLPDLHEFREKF